MTTGFIERYPHGKTFAVTMMDDTDGATLASIEPVYACLRDHGVFLTKTVWVLPAVAPSGRGGVIDTRTVTLADEPYRRFCCDLQDQGFELAMHTSSGGNDTRDRTILAYEIFEQTFGHPPVTNIMHGRNQQNIYWGYEVHPNPVVQRVARAFEPQRFSGHDPSSEYYWGDICREKTRYVRLFETIRTNTLAFDPATPYHDPAKPDVPWWFSASYGAGPRLHTLLAPRHIETLRRDRGASIIHMYVKSYAEPASGDRYRVQPSFQDLVRSLADQPDGWYVPVATLMDRLRAVRLLQVRVNGESITIENPTAFAIADLAINVPALVSVRDATGTDLAHARNAHGQVPLGTLDGYGKLQLTTTPPLTGVDRPGAPDPKPLNLALGTAQKLASQYLHGRRGRGFGRNAAQSDARSAAGSVAGDVGNNG